MSELFSADEVAGSNGTSFRESVRVAAELVIASLTTADDGAQEDSPVPSTQIPEASIAEIYVAYEVSHAESELLANRSTSSKAPLFELRTIMMSDEARRAFVLSAQKSRAVGQLSVAVESVRSVPVSSMQPASILRK